ncbi:hypothetical protein C0993_002726 [Termitomyces sp. T159_Od127]|nr:hypothetical protein C0993_002726 [Termitomyces sp. T159_Od127]
MRLYSVIVAAIAFSAPVIASPGFSIPVEKVNGETSGRHIVRLKPGVNQTSFFRTKRIAPTYSWTIINGFAGKFTEEQINEMRSSGDVESIIEDGVVRTSVVATQENATWGLSRLSSVGKLANQNPSALTFPFVYETTAGLGVDIYVVGEPSSTLHIVWTKEFGGRARWGTTFGGYTSADGDGHGTHCAGTAAGSSVGIARAANIIAVKVLGDDGSGYVSDAISGIDWVKTQASTSGRPSVISLSIAANSVSTAFDDAVTSITTSGVHVVIAAGNSNVDANNVSPARAPGAIAVGASTIADAKASFSNYGSVVALFAPGQNIISASITGPSVRFKIMFVRTYIDITGIRIMQSCLALPWPPLTSQV